MPENAPRFLGVRSFFYPFLGFKFLLRHPKLLSYVAIPVGVNTLLYGLLVWFAASRFGGWLESLLPRGEAWYWTVLFYLLGALFAVVLFLIMVYTFTIAGNLILAPFNDLLSEKVEWVYTGHRLEESFRLKAFVADMGRSFKAALGRLALYLAGFLALLALNLVPPIGPTISAAGITMYTLFFLGWDYFDYSMERKHFTFSVKRGVAFRNALTFLGFGAGTSLLLLIPLMNLLTIPVCVVGATLLFCDMRRAGRVPEISAQT